MLYMLFVACVVLWQYTRYRLYKASVRKAVGYRKRGGYIYFFRGRNEPFWNIKIGRASNERNLYSRLRSHRTANPYGVSVLGVFACKSDLDAENWVKRRFAGERLTKRNEWYRLSIDLWLFLWAVREPVLTKVLDSQLRSW